MKKMFVFAGLVLAASLASATPACTSETLNNYTTPGFSCTIDNLLFSGFTYSGSANDTTAIGQTAVNVIPVTTLGDEGLEFTAGWSVATPAELDSDIGFTVSTVNHADTINQLSLVFNGSYTGTGTSSVVENYCAGGTLSSCPSALNQIAVTNPPLKLSDTSQTFAGVNTLSVSKDVLVSSGASGTAYISELTNTYGNSSVPEPGTLGLIGGGLVGLGLLRKRS